MRSRFNRLFQNNKYLSPDVSKRWLQLLNNPTGPKEHDADFNDSYLVHKYPPDDICSMLTAVQMHTNPNALCAADILGSPEFQWFIKIRPNTLPTIYPTFLNKLVKTPTKVKFNPIQESRNILENSFDLQNNLYENCQFISGEDCIFTHFLKCCLLSLDFSFQELM